MAEQLISQLRRLNRDHTDFIDRCMVKVSELVTRECIRAAGKGLRRVEIDSKELAGELHLKDINDDDLERFASRLRINEDFKDIEISAMITKPTLKMMRKPVPAKRFIVATWR